MLTYHRKKDCVDGELTHEQKQPNLTPVSIDPTLTSSPHAIFPCCISSAPSRLVHCRLLPLSRPFEPGFLALLFPPQVAVRAIKE